MQDITHNLPEVIQANIAAHNERDEDTFISTFASDALLNDASREFFGHDAIRGWVKKEIFDDSVTMTVKKAYINHGNIIIHAIVDGTFDKSKLPDPVILTYYFSVRDEKITQLIILLNKDIY
ncbi:nuclear transport factor 2 family protein [Rouxiella sp. Mn2063]|uniref:nuclear transport factor 2 family protein n=1 Tax=Rouxiella sp. Mn2063 TaxID=3395262 RepID=UPI003BCEB3D7